MLLILTLMIVSSAWLLRAPGRRVAVSAVFQWVTRRLRIALGEHRLKDLVAQMIELTIASSVPSVTCTYMPVDLCFGISRDDDRRWGALLPLVAGELAELVSARAKTLGYTVSAKPRVSFVACDEVRPGHATIIRASLGYAPAAVMSTPAVAMS